MNITETVHDMLLKSVTSVGNQIRAAINEACRKHNVPPDAVVFKANDDYSRSVLYKGEEILRFMPPEVLTSDLEPGVFVFRMKFIRNDHNIMTIP